MICQSIHDGEEFQCAGNSYRMLVPRDSTRCLEAVLETLEPGSSTPSNAHETFVQLLVFLKGKGRVHIDHKIREVETPTIAFIPRNTIHFVENVGDEDLSYMYISIWPGVIPPVEDKPWREICAEMISDYALRGFPPNSKSSDD